MHFLYHLRQYATTLNLNLTFLVILRNPTTRAFGLAQHVLRRRGTAAARALAEALTSYSSCSEPVGNSERESVETDLTPSS